MGNGESRAEKVEANNPGPQEEFEINIDGRLFDTPNQDQNVQEQQRTQAQPQTQQPTTTHQPTGLFLLDFCSNLLMRDAYSLCACFLF